MSLVVTFNRKTDSTRYVRQITMLNPRQKSITPLNPEKHDRASYLAVGFQSLTMRVSKMFISIDTVRNSWTQSTPDDT